MLTISRFKTWFKSVLLTYLEKGNSQGEDAFFRHSLDMVCTVGIDGYFRRVNPSFTSVLGYSEEELTTKPIFDFIHPDDHEPTLTTLKNAGNGKNTVHFENRYRCKNGNFLTLSWTSKTDLETGIIYAVARDVTELRKSEADLKQVLHALKESALVSITDNRGVIIEANDLFCNISGYSREELIGKNHRIVNSGAHDKAFFAEIWKTIKSGKNWVGRIQNKTKDGRPYWVNTVITPLYDENKVINRFLSVRFDISNSVKTEMQLMESAKMASLGEMAGGIAHEINNPLAIIQAKSNQLFRHYQGGNVSAEKLGQGLKTIEETTARIAKIVHGLRSFSRDATGDPFTLHQVEDIVTDTLALCQSRYSKLGVSLKVVPFENTQFYCRPAQIEQILINLLGNALDAVEHLPQKWIELQVQTTETFILFRVTDSGAGIPDQVITNMMNPFFTTKPIGKGTGLGLSLSKGIAADHGGSIQYELYNGHTSFVLRISRALAVQNAA